MNLQAQLDKFLAQYPDFTKYYEWAKYVAQGMDIPEGTTHTLKVANLAGDDVVVAVKAKPPYGALLDVFLKVL